MVWYDIMRVGLVAFKREGSDLRHAALPFSTAELPTFAQFVRGAQSQLELHGFSEGPTLWQANIAGQSTL